MILVVPFLVKPFAAILADEWLHPLMDPHVSVEGRRPVKGLSARATNVRLLRSVNDLVATQGRCLTKPFITNLQPQTESFNIMTIVT